FRLPPREFVPLFVVNHAVFCLLVVSAMDLKGNRLFASLLGGLDAFLVSCLAAYFLYSREWKLFRKERLLAERNRELAQANALLHQRHEEMNEVMAITTHDLRSPLLNIRQLFELLKTEKEWREAPYQRVLTECGNACEDMLGLIRRLLDAHAAEQGKEQLC